METGLANNKTRAIVALLCLLVFRPETAHAERGRLFGGNASLNFGRRFFQLDRLNQTGFSRLRLDGNRLVAIATNQFGQQFATDLAILRNGQLVGNNFQPDAEIIRQVKEFVLSKSNDLRVGKPIQQFQANDALRFLAANGAGAALTGGLLVDLGNSVIPMKSDGKEPVGYAKGKENQVKLAALNYLLNTISQSRTLLRVGGQNVSANGLVGLNLGNFVNGAALALLTNNNPYDCSGTGRGPFRLDLLIARAMDPKFYRQIIGIPDDYKQLMRQLGTFNMNERRRTVGNKIVIGGPPGQEESIVGRHPQRMLEIQNEGNILGGSLYVSYDNQYNLPPGTRTQAANPFENGVDTAFGAGEMIFHKPNGFLAFALSNKDQQVQDSAPGEFASNGGRFNGALGRAEGTGPDVSAPVVCMTCHANGFIGGQFSFKANRPYTDNLNKIPFNHRQFFTTNAAYAARAKRDSLVFRNALVQAGAFIPNDDQSLAKVGAGGPPAAALLPDFYGEYHAPLTVAKAATELGVPAQRLAGLLRTRPDGTLSRKEFEGAFCGLKRALGAGGVGLAGDFFQQNALGGFGGGGFRFGLRGTASHR